MKFWLFLIFALFFSCKQYKPGTKRPYPHKASSSSQRLAELFPWTFILHDTLKVYSVDGDLENPTYPFKGIKLDSAQVAFFPSYLNISHDEIRPVYACCRFKINDYNWGLMARMGGEYSSTSIKLYVYNKATDSLYFYRELAEDFGDAGDVYRIVTWLYPGPAQTVHAFAREVRFHYNMVGDMNDTTVGRNIMCYRYRMLDPDNVLVEDTLFMRKFR
ncbi:MAG TPA: hypothetical protein VD905_16670 [Flavobacteriales bacterium]|nr:hypothetical protein [Flavobacteriales bacterium]